MKLFEADPYFWLQYRQLLIHLVTEHLSQCRPGQTVFEQTAPFTQKSFFFRFLAVFLIGAGKHGTFVI
jgi:hypothetical protein